MKWQNPENELIEETKKILSYERIIIYGAGEKGQTCIDLLKWLNIINSFEVVIVDSSESKQREQLSGYETLNPNAINVTKTDLIVICASERNSLIILDAIINKYQSIEKNQICTIDLFCKWTLPILMMSRFSILFSPSQCLIVTTHCNLNCKGCLNFTSFNRNKRNITFSDLKNDIDTYFSKFDRVQLFHLSGGEPLLNKCTAEIISYIGRNYRNQIQTFAVTSNGTIIPSDNLLEAMIEAKCEFIIDNYTKTNPLLTDKYAQVIQTIERKRIKYTEYKVSSWIDLAPDKTDNSNLSNDELIKYFDSCEVPYSSIRNGKIYSCNFASYAIEAGIIPESDNDFLEISKSSKQLLLEFRLRYTKKGFVDFCKNCAGFVKINKNIIKPAEQIQTD